MMALAWPSGLSGRRTPTDHGGLRRLQQLSLPAVEGRTGSIRRRDRPDGDRLPLPAGHLQVEQDRAPAVLPHHLELARQTAEQPRGRREQHRSDTNPYRATRPCQARHERVPDRIAISREYLRSLPINPHEHRGIWNYTIAPTGPNTEPATTADDRERARARLLAMLAEPQVPPLPNRGPPATAAFAPAPRPGASWWSDRHAIGPAHDRLVPCESLRTVSSAHRRLFAHRRHAGAPGRRWNPPTHPR